jgi:drug/metabolite transporter (DMT)-like permease
MGETQVNQPSVIPLSSASESRAALMLVVACLCWAISFPLVKNWQNAAAGCPTGVLAGGLTLMALRGALGLILLAVVQPRLFRQPGRRELKIGVLIGLVMWAGAALQVEGLAYTTPALSGFLTSLGSAWVPVLMFVCFRQSVSRPTLVGLGLGIGGVALLSFRAEHGIGLQPGDGLTLLASVDFAVVIILLDRLGRKVDSSRLTVAFIGSSCLASFVTALVLALCGPGVFVWLSWLATMLQDLSILGNVLLLTVFSTVVATYCLSTYQPRVSAGRAALIYLLEPLFTAVISFCTGHDSLTVPLILGGSLILGGNLLVEMRVWLRGWQKLEPEVPGRDPNLPP